MKCKTTIMSCKKKYLCLSEFWCLCSGRLQGRRHTHSDNLAEDVQKFISETSVSAYVRHVRSARRNMKKRNSGENFTPRWKIQTNTSCSVPFCSHVSAINNHPICWDEICSTVGIASVE